MGNKLCWRSNGEGAVAWPTAVAGPTAEPVLGPTAVADRPPWPSRLGHILFIMILQLGYKKPPVRPSVAEPPATG